MTGDDLDLAGTRLGHAHGRADRPHGLHRRRRQQVRGDHPPGRARGRLLFNTVGGGQGDYRAFLQSFAIVLDREIRSWPTIDFEEYPGGITGSNGAQISGSGASVRRRTWRSSSRPARSRSSSRPSTRPPSRPRSARTRPAGEDGLVGLLAVAIFLLNVLARLVATGSSSTRPSCAASCSSTSR